MFFGPSVTASACPIHPWLALNGCALGERFDGSRKDRGVIEWSAHRRQREIIR